MTEQRYSEEAVREILQQAMTEESHVDDFTEMQLTQMATELGISNEALVRAKSNYVETGASSSIRMGVDELGQLRISPQLRRQFDQERWRGFLNRALIYLVFILLLFGINIVSDSGDWWFFYPALGFGFILAINALRIASTRLNPAAYEDALIDWLAKRVERRQLLTKAGKLLSDE